MKNLLIAIGVVSLGFVGCEESTINPSSELTYGIRHDRSIEEYEDLASQQANDAPDFSSVICFTYSLDGTDNQEFVATGTLVAEEWILTAGHNFYVEEEQSEPAPVSGITVLVGNNPNSPDQTYDVEKIVYHPTWIQENMDFLKANDLCLVKLATPITDRQPMNYWNSSTEPLGEQIWFCGFGDYSRLEGQDPDAFSRKHAVQNILDRKVSGIITESNGVTYNGGLLAFDFDHPDETINSLGDDIINADEELLGIGDSAPEPLDYEGATVQGDSGGPLLMRDGQEWKLAGVLSGGASEPIDNHNDASYGDISVFIRVSSQSDWIREVITE